MTTHEPDEAEVGIRLSPPEPGDPWRQINFRGRESMRDAIEARRTLVGISRDEWLRRAVEWALLQPPGTLVRRPRRGRRARP